MGFPALNPSPQNQQLGDIFRTLLTECGVDPKTKFFLDRESNEVRPADLESAENERRAAMALTALWRLREPDNFEKRPLRGVLSYYGAINHAQFMGMFAGESFPIKNPDTGAWLISDADRTSLRGAGLDPQKLAALAGRDGAISSPKEWRNFYQDLIRHRNEHAPSGREIGSTIQAPDGTITETGQIIAVTQHYVSEKITQKSIEDLIVLGGGLDLDQATPEVWLALSEIQVDPHRARDFIQTAKAMERVKPGWSEKYGVKFEDGKIGTVSLRSYLQWKGQEGRVITGRVFIKDILDQVFRGQPSLVVSSVGENGRRTVNKTPGLREVLSLYRPFDVRADAPLTKATANSLGLTDLAGRRLAINVGKQPNSSDWCLRINFAAIKNYFLKSIGWGAEPNSRSSKETRNLNRTFGKEWGFKKTMDFIHYAADSQDHYGRVNGYSERFESLYQYVVESLRLGIPVMVGGSHSKRSRDNDGVTDHWGTIRGVDIEANSEDPANPIVYFIMEDNADGGERKLYVDQETHQLFFETADLIERNIDIPYTYNIFRVGMPNGERERTGFFVSAVRLLIAPPPDWTVDGKPFNDWPDAGSELIDPMPTYGNGSAWPEVKGSALNRALHGFFKLTGAFPNTLRDSRIPQNKERGQVRTKDVGRLNH